MTEIKWTRVETKPTTNREVLIWIDRQGSRMAQWSEQKQEWYSWQSLNDSEQARVTHWADVPEPEALPIAHQ